MRTKQALPYIAALLLLAWTLGSLARTGPGPGSILFNSYWLIYALELLPVVALVAMVGMIVFLAWYWRLLSDALGVGMAARRKTAYRQKYWIVRMIAYVAVWGLAVAVLTSRCGGTIFCNLNATESLASVSSQVTGQTTSPGSLPFAEASVMLTRIVGSGWFMVAFLGLIIVSSVIVGRAMKVGWGEIKEFEPPTPAVQREGTRAVQDAVKILERDEAENPRESIIQSYLRMIMAAAAMGAPVAADQTARELERGIREIFHLSGQGIRELTRLFEEARYSLHPITETDSQQALTCLTEIGRELKAAVAVEN